MTLAEHPVFAIAGTEYRWADVAFAAMHWDEWAEVEAKARHGFTCAARAHATGGRPPRETLTARANDYRYEHDLISAEQTVTWLRRRGLTTAMWMEWVEWCLLRDQEVEGVSESSTYADEAEAERAALVEGICSGHLVRVAGKLAGRAAVHAALGSKPDSESLPAPPSVAELDSSFDRFQTMVVTTRAVQDRIASHHLDWIRLDYRTARFATEDATREAALAVRADGVALAEVAVEAHVPLSAERVYLEHADPALRDRLLGAKAGDLVGPLHLGDAFMVLQVDAKVLPSIHDPDVRRLAEANILEGAVAREMANRVTWYLGP
ncbi:MAG: hypothetical protein H0T44_02290 [Gemmatimonadales bacterium]|nr:hypothetical protein [Gemmatimonadales bacterium]